MSIDVRELDKKRMNAASFALKTQWNYLDEMENAGVDED
jgi:hypothetical protein